jgi:hypothetical protein
LFLSSVHSNYFIYFRFRSCDDNKRHAETTNVGQEFLTNILAGKNFPIPTFQYSISLSKDLISAILQDSKVLAEPVVPSIRNLVHEVRSEVISSFQNWLLMITDVS